MSAVIDCAHLGAKHMEIDFLAASNREWVVCSDCDEYLRPATPDEREAYLRADEALGFPGDVEYDFEGGAIAGEI